MKTTGGKNTVTLEQELSNLRGRIETLFEYFDALLFEHQYSFPLHPGNVRVTPEISIPYYEETGKLLFGFRIVRLSRTGEIMPAIVTWVPLGEEEHAIGISRTGEILSGHEFISIIPEAAHLVLTGFLEFEHKYIQHIKDLNID